MTAIWRGFGLPILGLLMIVLPAGTESPQPDRSHFFYKHSPYVRTTRFEPLRECEPDAAMRYLDANETISNERTAKAEKADEGRT
mgnify:CR=1 FL=1